MLGESLMKFDDVKRGKEKKNHIKLRESFVNAEEQSVENDRK